MALRPFLSFDGEERSSSHREKVPEDRPRKKQEKTVFYRLPSSGGEAVRAFELPFRLIPLKKYQQTAMRSQP